MIFSDWSLRAGLAGICLGLLGSAPATLAGEVAARLTFEQHVRPILKAHCFSCHGEEEKPKGRLDLRLVRTMTKGGTSGEAIVAGRHEESLLWERIDGDEMPPGEKKLTPEQKATITAWIDQGAATIRPEPEALAVGAVVTEEDRTFWSFRPIRRPEVPRVRDASRVRTPIDAFLLERLEAEGLGFAPEADRRTLIRRITFDLTGLPPTPAEVEEFVADGAPDALERLVDRLLATPRYGEHWARHWLDVAGYADSDGYTPKDLERKYAWKYRDYVVRALNADRPWDELIREQLAGDEMVAPPYANLAPADVDKLIATGFLRMAPDGTGDPGADPERGAERRGRRDDQDRIERVPGPDRRLRPVPRPPLRPDLPRGLLPVPRPVRAGPRLEALAQPARATGLALVRRRPPAALPPSMPRSSRSRASAPPQWKNWSSRSSSASWPPRPRSCVRRSGRPATPPLRSAPRAGAAPQGLPPGQCHGRQRQPLRRQGPSGGAGRLCQPGLRGPEAASGRGRGAGPDRGGGAGPHDLPVRTGRLRAAPPGRGAGRADDPRSGGRDARDSGR